MKKGSIITLGAMTLTALWAGALAPRRNHPGWEKFENHRYAHRGLHDLEAGRPENSLAAFRAAAERGYGAELDVHLMRDGNLAVVHDSSLVRVCGADVLIEDLCAEDLPNYRLYDTDETVPLFEDVLKIFERKTPLIIELKTANGNASELTDAVMNALRAWGGDYCVESFDPMVLARLKSRYPQVFRGQLSSDFIRFKGDSSVPFTSRAAITYLLTTFLTKPDFIAYNERDRDNLSLRLMKWLYGVHEVSWTVRDEELLHRLEGEGVPAIFEGFIPQD